MLVRISVLQSAPRAGTASSVTARVFRLGALEGSGRAAKSSGMVLAATGAAGATTGSTGTGAGTGAGARTMRTTRGADGNSAPAARPAAKTAVKVIQTAGWRSSGRAGAAAGASQALEALETPLTRCLAISSLVLSSQAISHSSAAIHSSCSLRRMGSDRMPYAVLTMAMMRAALSSPGFLSGWYFWLSALYAARMTSCGAMRATFRLS